MDKLELISWAAAVFLLMPMFYAASAVFLPVTGNLASMWRMAGWVAGTAMAAVLAGSAFMILGGPEAQTVRVSPGFYPLFDVRMDVLTVAMSLLIAFISMIILRYAKNYLAGDPGQPRFVRWFFGTVASVSLLVASNHLFVMLAGWISASVCLHQLLTYFSSRPQALLAAHKKFLLSRLADVLLLAAFVTIGQHYGSYRLDRLFELIGNQAVLPLSVQTATVLIALATILKCAQLPFHGWLIQVMEAPTPISALLHAGVVNIGGFLLIRLAPLMSISPTAQWLLVAAGSLTAVVAGLIMMTRISVKVMLAWSTCAQMGFMLMECGLGAYPLALLHLLAHSLYKAHCFLASGRAVEQNILHRLAPTTEQHWMVRWTVAAFSGFAAVALAAWLAGFSPSEEPALWALSAVVAFGVATLMGEALAAGNSRLAFSMAVIGLATSLLYFAWHHLFVAWAALPAAHAAPVAGTVIWVFVLFALQFVVYAAIRIAPGHPLISNMQSYLYHGLYLDELFTRATFRIWPPRMSRGVAPVNYANAIFKPEGAFS